MDSTEALNKLLSLKLTRKEDGFYTVGDETFDHFFGLGQEKPIYAPNKESVLAFATTSYILAFCGYKVESFTATSIGYLATYTRTGADGKVESMTLSIDSEKNIFLKQTLIKTLVETSKQTDAREGVFLLGIAMALKTNSLLKTSILVAKSAEAKLFKDQLLEAIFQFNGGRDEKGNLLPSVNNNNCTQNHFILDNLCKGLDMETAIKYAMPFLDKENQEKLLQSKENNTITTYDVILNYLILPGYRNYRAGEGQVLNQADRVQAIFNMTGSVEKTSAVLTMCATDYTADVVFEVLKILSNPEDKDNLENKIDEIVPDTPSNIIGHYQADKALQEVSTEK